LKLKSCVVSVLLVVFLIVGFSEVPTVKTATAATDASFIFGWDHDYTNYTIISNLMVGTNFTFADPVETQVKLPSLTLYYGQHETVSNKIKYALYNSELNLIASTNEYVGIEGSQTLIFTDPPTLTNNTMYWLVAWGSCWTFQYHTPASGNSKSFNMSVVYTGNYPSTLSPSSYSNIIWSIYGAYSTRETLIDSYPTPNGDYSFGLADLHPSDSIYSSVIGQTFNVTGDSMYLTKAQFYMGKNGLPTGTDAKAVLYATTGTYGVNATPTGSPIATSQNFAVTDIDDNHILIYTFKFFSHPLLNKGTVYAIVFQNPTSGTINLYNLPIVHLDRSSPTHSGNSFRYRNGVWNLTYATSRDLIFYVYGVPQLLNLRIKDANGNIIEGATAYINSSTETSDSDGWVKTTCPINSSVDIHVKLQNVVVNGTWTVTMNADKTFNVSCTVYKLTVYVTNDKGVEMSGTTLTLSRTDGENLSSYDLTPKTVDYYNTTHGRYVWSQLANQTSSYTVTATVSSGESNSTTTTLTANTVKTIVIPTIISSPPGTPSYVPPPPAEQPPALTPPIELPKVPGPEFQYGIMVLVGVVVVAAVVGVAGRGKRKPNLQRKWQKKTRQTRNLDRAWRKKRRR